ncbi:MAG: PilZ domain-containing protein [Pseudomonadota bacterium]|nr:PilZ domain-containing protein [Pseudomonadota bacterium]
MSSMQSVESDTLEGWMEGALLLTIPSGTPVRVLHAAGSPVHMSASVVRTERDLVELRLTHPEDIPVGARLILELPAPAPPRAVAIVTERAGSFITARVVRLPTVDRREYPRLWGMVSLRYRLAGGHGQTEAQSIQAWMCGAQVEGVDRMPDPRMDVSATGLAFEDEAHVREGERVLATVALPGEGGGWRCVGRVVRVLPIPERELRTSASAGVGIATHRIAILFDSIPDEATAAFVRYTARLQESMLLGMAPRGATEE